jgi:hypothetical protein
MLENGCQGAMSSMRRYKQSSLRIIEGESDSLCMNNQPRQFYCLTSFFTVLAHSSLYDSKVFAYKSSSKAGLWALPSLALKTVLKSGKIHPY